MLDKKKLIAHILRVEGGYSNVSTDNGGETYCGISRKAWPEWKGWMLVEAHKPLKRNEVVKCDKLEKMVTDFYGEHFFDKLRLDEVESVMIACHLMCHGVNAGCGPAVKLLQRSINSATGSRIAVDGVIGPVTIGYCNGSISDAIAQEFIRQRTLWYKSLNQPANLHGWLNRVRLTTEAGRSMR